MTGPFLAEPGVHPCELHAQHEPRPLVTVRHHIWPRGMGGPDEPGNVLWACDTGHRNVHYLMGPLANGRPMPRGGTYAERAAAREGFDRWVRAGRPGDPHAAYALGAGRMNETEDGSDDGGLRATGPGGPVVGGGPAVGADDPAGPAGRDPGDATAAGGG